jgi:heptosyltransferase-2
MQSNSLKKLLVISPNWLGDAIMSEPLLNVLSKEYHYSINVFAPNYLADVFKAMPYVDTVHKHTIAHKEFNLKQLWHYAKQFKNQYHACLILPNSLKSAVMPWLCRIPNRFGFYY